MVVETVVLLAGAGWAGRKIVKKAKAHHREKKARKQELLQQQIALLQSSPSARAQMQPYIEATIRRLSRATTGVIYQSTLLVFLPTQVIALSLNIISLIGQYRRLLKLADMFGGIRNVFHQVSHSQLIKQIGSGVALKTLTTFLFFGNDFNDWMHGLNHATDHIEGVKGSHELTELLTSGHDNMLHDGILEYTAHPADKVVDLVKESLDSAPLAGGTEQGWLWTDHRPVGQVMEVAAVVGLVDKTIDKVVEEPVDRAMHGKVE